MRGKGEGERERKSSPSFRECEPYLSTSNTRETACVASYDSSLIFIPRDTRALTNRDRTKFINASHTFLASAFFPRSKRENRGDPRCLYDTRVAVNSLVFPREKVRGKDRGDRGLISIIVRLIISSSK